MYKWIKVEQLVQRLADGALIPNDATNKDWRDFDAWRQAGGAPTPADPEPVPPSQAELNAACVAGIATAPAPQFGFDIRRAFIAKAISDEAYRLGVAPGALTGAQLTALRNRLAAIYQAL